MCYNICKCVQFYYKKCYYYRCLKNRFLFFILQLEPPPPPPLISSGCRFCYTISKTYHEYYAHRKLLLHLKWFYCEIRRKLSFSLAKKEETKKKPKHTESFKIKFNNFNALQTLHTNALENECKQASD